VDVGTPLADQDELQSLLDITGQLTRMLTRTNADRRREMLRPGDILIKPKLGDISSGDFARTLDTIALGRDATAVHAAALARLALSEEDFAAHTEPLRRASTDIVSTQELRIVADASKVEKGFLLRTMRIPSDPELHVNVLEQSIGRAYGLSLFEEVSYDAEADGVSVRPRRKTEGPNYLRMGLNMAGDLSGRTRFSLGASITATELNLPGAEWRSEIEVGSDARLLTELYQPFSALGGGFLAPSVQFRAYNYGLYLDEDLVAEYRVRQLAGTLAVGTELSNWGEMRVGITEGIAGTNRIVGDPILNNIDDDLGLVFFRFSMDTLDSLFFPASGLRGKFEWRRSDPKIGGEEAYEAIEFDGAFAANTGRHRVILAAKGGSVYDGTAPLLQAFQLGGFLNLSGLEPDQLTGQQMFLGRAIYLREMVRSLFLPTYLGMSLEAGEVWQDKDDVSLADLRIAGSVFIGFDTILGPLYLGGGWAEGGDRAAYIRMGKTF
ncbi:MAG: BamA/TamA family outer membrane protein, partial [Gammaproteobacteria bacterium]|nr:BamA/TamA family outer membrane protein [Gammaproteobacteria bacterium]